MKVEVLAIQRVLGEPDQGVATLMIHGLSYSAVLQQLTRHRSFAFSVKSSRAADLSLDFVPDWSEKAGKGMFSQAPVKNPLKRKALDAIWASDLLFSKAHAAMLKAMGVHRQHYQLPVKAHATVDVLVTGTLSSWSHFLDLRLKDKTAQVDITNVAQKCHDALLKEFNGGVATMNLLKVYGPYIPVEGVDVSEIVRIDNDGTITLIGDLPPSIIKAVAKVARATTGSQISDPVKDAALVKRLIEDRHASPFEHLWTRSVSQHPQKSCLATEAVTLRAMLPRLG